MERKGRGPEGSGGDEASKHSGSAWTREGMRAAAGNCFSYIPSLDHVNQGECGVASTQMAEWQSEPLYSPLCGQAWWPGGHRIPNSAELPCPSLVLPELSSQRPWFQARRTHSRSGVSDHYNQGQSPGSPQTPPGLSSHGSCDISMLPTPQIMGRATIEGRRQGLLTPQRLASSESDPGSCMGGTNPQTSPPTSNLSRGPVVWKQSRASLHF